MDLILQGLEVTGIGLATVFTVLVLFYGMILLLQKVFADKKEQ